MIIHVTTPASWAEALAKGIYEAPSLKAEGFIHCCRKEQVEGVITRYYSHIPNLVLLYIDPNKLVPPVEYALSAIVQEEFPHVFGPINLDAVEAVIPRQA